MEDGYQPGRVGGASPERGPHVLSEQSSKRHVGSQQEVAASLGV